MISKSHGRTTQAVSTTGWRLRVFVASSVEDVADRRQRETTGRKFRTIITYFKALGLLSRISLCSELTVAC